MPTHAKYARMFLAVRGSSASPEQLFSSAGNILDKKRCNMDPAVLSDLVFCSENYHLVTSPSTDAQKVPTTPAVVNHGPRNTHAVNHGLEKTQGRWGRIRSAIVSD